MTVPTLTIDTSVVIAMTEENVDAVELYRRGKTGAFDIAVSTRVRYQLQRPIADDELRAFVEGLTTLPSPGRWDFSTWDGDVWANGPEPRPNVSLGSKLDDDHLEAHRMARRDHFVTLDGGQLNRALALRLSAMSPADLLACYPST